ncbi:MAG: MFS transporter [Candidatus Velthaea sp.]
MNGEPSVESRSAANPRRRFPFHYVVVALTFCVLLVAAGIRSAPGVLMVPMETEMGWSATTISTAIAINIVLFGLMGPFAAALMQSMGVRRTLLLGLGIVAVSSAATSRIASPAQLILTWGVGVGVGVGMIGIVVAATVSTRWFYARRGTVMGVLTAANATGQLVFLPVLALVAQKFGWRPVGLLVGAVALVVAIPIAFFMRDRPEDIGLRPFGAPADLKLEEPPLLRGGNPLRTAFASLGRASKKRDFWFLFGTFFVCGASTNGFIGTHFIPACGDHGIPEVRAAGYLAMMGAFDLVGTTVSGWLSDRWSSRYLLFWYYGLRGLSLLFVPYAFGVSGVLGLPLFALFYGLDWVATVPPTVRLTIDAFGREEGPLVFGWVSAGHQLGAGAIALVAGMIRTTSGTYTGAFELSAILCLISAVAVLGIRAGRSTPSDPSEPRIRQRPKPAAVRA